MSAAPESSTLLEGGPTASSSPCWLAGLREAGHERFRSAGVPTQKHEAWRFTDLSSIRKQTFVSAPNTAAPPVYASLVGDEPHLRVDCINGRISPITTPAIEGISISRFSDLQPTAYSLPPSLGSVVKLDDHVFAALNTAWLLDGLYVRVAKGKKITQPLLLNLLSTAGAAPVMSHPRHLIHLEAGAELTLVEDCQSAGTGTHFVNPVMEIILEAGSRLEHFKIQRESSTTIHIGNVGVKQATGSQYISRLVVLGGHLVRNDIETRLEGTQAECELLGLYVAGGQALVDTHTLMDHVAPSCKSRETYHGILTGRAHGVFNGRVIVEQGAQHSDSAQSTRTLMLSDTAMIDAKPQLEILADDVKCSHGATVGRLDEESLHYLRARGISEADAKRMLTMAFGRQILDGIQQEGLRTALEGLVEGMLDV